MSISRVVDAFRATALFCATALVAQAQAQPVSPAEARAIAKEAVIYGFPLVDTYRVQHSYFVDRSNPEFKAPWNQIANRARVYTPEDKAIQTPNSDTPYSQLGLDLRAEPIVLGFPDVEKGRYYSAQFIDLYTFNFAYVGSRATGNGAGHYLLVGPRWKGEKPKGVKAVIRSETDLVFVLYRTQLFDAGDIEKVKRIQAGYTVPDLVELPGRERTARRAGHRLRQALEPRRGAQVARVLQCPELRPPVLPDPPVRAGPDGALREAWHRRGEDLRCPRAVTGGPPGGRRGHGRRVEGLRGTQDDQGGHGHRGEQRQLRNTHPSEEQLHAPYVGRGAGHLRQLEGRSAIYPAYFVDADKQKLDGGRRYRLTFPPGQLPPANAFWSLTLYELPSSLLYANALNRYLINSPMIPSLKRDPDGGTTLYVQNDSPGADKEANWLPAPKGPFFAVLRVYWPKAEALDGKWKAPPLRQAP
jgi:hypothetical protein